MKKPHGSETEVLPLESCSFKVLADLAASPWKWFLYIETVATHYTKQLQHKYSIIFLQHTLTSFVCAIAPVFASVLHRHLDCDPRSIHLARSFVCTTIGCMCQHTAGWRSIFPRCLALLSSISSSSLQAHEVRNGGGAYSAYRDDEFVDETRRQ